MDPAVASRAFSCIADFLGAMAGNSGGLRSGPGGNKTWMRAFELLEEGQIEKGALALKRERLKWMDRPDRMMRAARHYEGALQVLIRKAVLTAEKYIITAAASSQLPFGQWVVAEGPARMDLFGGWTDTPPICYELGGSVINVAVLVDGQKPIGARARRIHELHIVITPVHHNVPEEIEIFSMQTFWTIISLVLEAHTGNGPHGRGTTATVLARVVPGPLGRGTEAMISATEEVQFRLCRGP
ncbi:hypothetical protein HPB51_012500 [Rhipicephalus microplus]|uniref:Uncharacterized protein n=1 Tax=Rhipicephalus microplus TaxID=6941 RepID=A0A9J6DGI4_RHIMP|nr:hypothetical protein HPB51_012500 [Rhipicephalus microplus]